MFRLYSKIMIEHTWQLISIYESALKHGKFNRNIVAADTNIKMSVVEGRWYGELKRRLKLGENYDWKTVLNAFVIK